MKHYRDKVIHEGYLDFRGGGYDMRELLHITRHLYDVIARICLKRLGYEGTYQPSMIIDDVPSTVDWVTISTTAFDLGYAPFKRSK